MALGRLVVEELVQLNLESATIRDCIIAIQRGGANIAVVVDGEGLFVGIVTDGDLRRAWLKGSQLSDTIAPFVQKAPLTVDVGASRTAVLELMQARGIAQVPVIDQHGRLHGVHLMREFLSHSPRPNIALVLAGGRGERLGSLTDSVPKPMIPVAGRPILERIVTHLVGWGITQISLAVGYRSEVIEEYFLDGTQFGCSIQYLREDQPLGTGGPLASLRDVHPQLEHPILVMNGDLVTQFAVGGILDHHEAAGCDMTIGTFTYAHEIPFGVLKTGSNGSVLAVDEKPLRVETVSAGIYVIAPALLRNLPQDTQFPMTQFVSEAVEQGARVSSWDCGQDWTDVGRPRDLARARGQAWDS